MKFKITGKNYSGTFNGEENFKATARAILQDNGLSTADFFKLKSVKDYIDALKEKGFEVEKERTVYDDAKDAAPHLSKYINEMEADAEGKVPASAQITKIKITNENGSKTMGKPVGTYITAEIPPLGKYGSYDENLLCALGE